MSTIDLEDHLARLQDRRSQLVARLARLDEEIEATQIVISSLESPIQSQSDAPSQASGAKRSSSSARGPKASDHSAVRALRSVDIRPYERFERDLPTLALRYAELHDGEIDMQGLVPLAIRVGLCKSAYYKDAWSSVYRAVRRGPAFVPAGKGRFVVSPVTDEAGAAGVA